MLLIDKPGTGRSISREQAVNLNTFVNAVEYGFIHDTMGEIQYAATVVIDGNLYGAQFCWAGETEFSQDRVSEGITQLYADLATEGVIGHKNLLVKQTVTLTGNPAQDLLQVADQMIRPDDDVYNAVAKRYAALHPDAS